ncbi:hypothetical protein SLEP1_g9464 [Rubroshorea leprosula]|uniref:Uncharacterized protein n=1 Tax=Rubroshorea leprosula TaxID=152421 RepID=A0AAV5IAY4_9ROSI|nr:hypothetical protein SLEP1_g9464 [Rubroshorea leprosula]
MENQSSSSSSSTMILHNALIVTMDAESRVFRNGAIVIEHEEIKAIGHSPQILQQFSDSDHQSVDLRGQILLPGHLLSFHCYFSRNILFGSRET